MCTAYRVRGLGSRIDPLLARAVGGEIQKRRIKLMLWLEPHEPFDGGRRGLLKRRGGHHTSDRCLFSCCTATP